MSIHYENEKEFYAGIYALLKAGLTFKANHASLSIELTGGY
jgi:hypothetical protein